MNIRKLFYDNHWTIGFIQNDMNSILGGDRLNIKWVKNPYKNRWFADPFILDIDNENITLLVEEFYDQINRGRISKLVIEKKNYHIIEVKPILELDSHLSFPAILRRNEYIYIYPENSGSGELSLYQYNPSNDSCNLVQSLCKEPLTDAILTDLLGDIMLFSTHLPTQNGNVLSSYKYKEGVFVYNEDFVFNSNVARNAGDWFEYGGNIYRPAQDCNQRYGGAMFIQRVIKEKDGILSFIDVRRIEEQWAGYKLGCHTFNHHRGVTVIDVNGYRRPFFAKLGLELVALRKYFK